MANNYLQFSFDFIVPESQCGWVKEVFRLADEASGDDLPEGSPLADIFPDWNEYQSLDFDANLEDDGSLWIYAEEYGNTEQVCAFLVELLGRCHEAGEDLKQVGFTYSETCSSMRVGEFGGGAVIVRVHDTGEVSTDWMNAHHWLTEALEDEIPAPVKGL